MTWLLVIAISAAYIGLLVVLLTEIVWLFRMVRGGAE